VRTISSIRLPFELLASTHIKYSTVFFLIIHFTIKPFSYPRGRLRKALQAIQATLTTILLLLSHHPFHH
jgi:hypothetical protein